MPPRLLPHGLRSPALLVAASAAGALAFYSVSRQTIYSDAPPQKLVSPSSFTRQTPAFSKGQSALVWGSNQNGLLDPSFRDTIKTPTLSSLFPPNVALRSISLHEHHAACVDARGDVYQWGPNFSAKDTTPQRTLTGKNISEVVSTVERVIAISKSSGKIYLLSSHKELQSASKSSSRWFGFGSTTDVDAAEVVPETALHYGEKFQYISAGRSHLLALTSKGRTFSLPLSLNANSHGQLGLRNVTLASSSSPSVVQEELDPLGEADPFSQSTPFKRLAKDEEGQLAFVPIRTGASQKPLVKPTTKLAIDDRPIRFSTILKEIPALRGLSISQIATGDRTSFARMGGQVLAWGANEHGQLGLGATVTLPYVTTPSEINLSRGLPAGTMAQCSSITASGDTAYFTVKGWSTSGKHTSTDVFSCGHGQWGGLGNGVFSSSQGEPIRIKALSGLTEYDEKRQESRPIGVHEICASSTGHAMVTLDTAAPTDSTSGRDLYIWGSNRSYELGDGRKTSQPVPKTITGPEEQRLLLRGKVMDINDMSGKLWRRSAKAEQAIAAGYGCSMIYWRIIE